ncbi:MAG TPA: DNA-directed RNA polymerase subunit omega [Armatimonadota bacterium]|nr:DNA-directed RNA polymerase subunit omega [Armatimonadota bacterium]
MRKTEAAAGKGHEVQVDRLSHKFGKYALVMAVAKRARHMKERAAGVPLGPSPASYIARALQDVAKGHVKVTRGRDE